MFQTTNQIMIIQKTSKTSEDTMTASQRGGIFFGSPTDSAAKKTIQVQLTRNTKKVNLNLTIFQQTYATRRLNRCQPQSNFNRLEIVSIDDSVVHEGWPKTTGWQNHPIGILVNSPAIRGLPKKQNKVTTRKLPHAKRNDLLL